MTQHLKAGSVEGLEAPVPSNAQMIAELQGLAIAIRMFGLDGLEAMTDRARLSLTLEGEG